MDERYVRSENCGSSEPFAKPLFGRRLKEDSRLRKRTFAESQSWRTWCTIQSKYHQKPAKQRPLEFRRKTYQDSCKRNTVVDTALR
jgi:hypothetical protein